MAKRSMILRRGGAWLSGAAAVALLVGCGDKWTASRPRPVPVSGTVLYQDQPVEGATVVFVPEGHDYAAAGVTDASGRFELRTFEPGDGAVPGDYKVTVRKVETSGALGSSQDDDAERPSPTELWLLPGRYADPQSSDLTATVTERGNDDLVFKLSGTPGPPQRRQPARSGSSGE
jgi:hypothetical protein